MFCEATGKSPCHQARETGHGEVERDHLVGPQREIGIYSGQTVFFHIKRSIRFQLRRKNTVPFFRQVAKQLGRRLGAPPKVLDS